MQRSTYSANIVGILHRITTTEWDEWPSELKQYYTYDPEGAVNRH